MVWRMCRSQLVPPERRVVREAGLLHRSPPPPPPHWPSPARWLLVWLDGSFARNSRRCIINERKSEPLKQAAARFASIHGECRKIPPTNFALEGSGSLEAEPEVARSSSFLRAGRASAQLAMRSDV